MNDKYPELSGQNETRPAATNSAHNKHATHCNKLTFNIQFEQCNSISVGLFVVFCIACSSTLKPQSVIFEGDLKFLFIAAYVLQYRATCPSQEIEKMRVWEYKS